MDPSSQQDQHDQPTGRAIRPFAVTYALIAANVLAYIAEIVAPEVLARFSMLGRGLLRDGKLYDSGGVYYPGFEQVGVANGEWYRLITGGFLHQPPTSGFGILHIVFNMLWLVMFGRILEPALGHLRFGLLYLVSLLGGSLLVLVANPDASTVGASGAVYGLAGAYFVLARRLQVDRVGARNLAIYFVVWLVVSASFASWQGHLGGLLAGLAVGAIYLFTPVTPLPTLEQSPPQPLADPHAPQPYADPANQPGPHPPTWPVDPHSAQPYTPPTDSPGPQPSPWSANPHPSQPSPWSANPHPPQPYPSPNDSPAPKPPADSSGPDSPDDQGRRTT